MQSAIFLTRSLTRVKLHLKTHTRKTKRTGHKTSFILLYTVSSSYAVLLSLEALHSPFAPKCTQVSVCPFLLTDVTPKLNMQVTFNETPNTKCHTLRSVPTELLHSDKQTCDAYKCNTCTSSECANRQNYNIKTSAIFPNAIGKGESICQMTAMHKCFATAPNTGSFKKI